MARKETSSVYDSGLFPKIGQEALEDGYISDHTVLTHRMRSIIVDLFVRCVLSYSVNLCFLVFNKCF